MDELKRINPEYLEQLAFGFAGMEEGEEDTTHLSDAERQQRSTRARLLFDELTRQKSELCTWYEMFQTLLESQWPWRVAAYVAWASSPKRERWPKTQNELATEVLGLTSDRVIATWRRKMPDIDGAITLLQAAPMLAHRADVIAALVESASQADHRSNPDRKLFFEMIGDYVPRAKVDLRDTTEADDSLAGLSEAELKEAAARAKEKRRASQE